eukprot:CAMPEP_0194364392 /NCGR_PEP_ID=MMETSP0174-20130528/12321_1 /TAXON_ID=216777 /ORGANISM="Proboscia alata, Strain PI-D3" /LENGTH=145 /DNA_ID=CAMNT_0039138407 /DNA_START=36 /DNA_END=471 /DNA_ORIENTATION=-
MNQIGRVNDEKVVEGQQFLQDELLNTTPFDDTDADDAAGGASAPETPFPPADNTSEDIAKRAASKLSTLTARTSASPSSFTGSSLGIGGLDPILSQIKRRIWTPLAAPPHLLAELGISPSRGLLLYGDPGCGKTLLARKLGGLLS